MLFLLLYSLLYLGITIFYTFLYAPPASSCPPELPFSGDLATFGPIIGRVCRSYCDVVWFGLGAVRRLFHALQKKPAVGFLRVSECCLLGLFKVGLAISEFDPLRSLARRQCVGWGGTNRALHHVPPLTFRTPYRYCMVNTWYEPYFGAKLLVFVWRTISAVTGFIWQVG